MPPPILRYLKNGPFMLLTASAFLGAMAVAAKIACAHLPVGEVMFIRFLGGWLIFWPLVRGGLVDLKPVNRKLLYVRGLSASVAIMFYFYGISKVPIGHAVLLNNTYPLFVALLSIPVLKERVGLDLYACFALALVGVAVMLGPAASAQGGPILGYLSTLISAVFAAVSILATRVLRRTDGALAIFYYFSLVGTVLTAPFIFVNPVLPAGPAAGALLAMIGFSVAGQLLINQAFKYARAGEGSIVLMATTAVAATLGAVLLGDRYGPSFFIGAFLIFAAISWVTARARVQVAVASGAGRTPSA
ncbi:MAG: DMT family transporter [Myxococcota bacterium]